MDVKLHFLSALASVLALVINTILNFILPRRKPTYAPINNRILTKSMGDLTKDLISRQLKSEDIVAAYINRIKEVNPCLNAVADERFAEALKEAQHADQLIERSNPQQLLALFTRHPLLGLPFTVKECCSVKGLSFAVGSVHRLQKKATENGHVVELLRAAGGIPLLVSVNPEFCLSFESYTHINGRCLNPYDLRRTSGGSSAGEGALNGSGASLFGLGSDIGGSIRLPALFCGVFGHKPTGGLVSISGHFPNSSKDTQFPDYLQSGPMTRFAKDLPILLKIMAGQNAEKLTFDKSVPLKDIKVHYAFNFGGCHITPDFDVKLSINRAVKCFEKGGLTTKEVKIEGFKKSLEISLAGLMGIKGVPSIISQSAINKPSTKVLVMEMIRALIGHSLYTKEAVFMEMGQSLNALMSTESIAEANIAGGALKQELMDLLGKDGVLLFPTFHTSAVHNHTSILNLVGIDFMVLWNILGFPATHVPMGLNRHGLPTGFQVIAAPYQDKLCLQIAAELEVAFGGWVPLSPNEI